jgi:hypothetical protein
LKRSVFSGQSIKSSVTLFTLSVVVVSLLTLSLFAIRFLQSDAERLAGELRAPTAPVVAGKVAH